METSCTSQCSLPFWVCHRRLTKLLLWTNPIYSVTAQLYFLGTFQCLAFLHCADFISSSTAQSIYCPQHTYKDISPLKQGKYGALLVSFHLAKVVQVGAQKGSRNFACVPKRSPMKLYVVWVSFHSNQNSHVTWKKSWGENLIECISSQLILIFWFNIRIIQSNLKLTSISKIVPEKRTESGGDPSNAFYWYN